MIIKKTVTVQKTADTTLEVASPLGYIHGTHKQVP